MVEIPYILKLKRQIHKDIALAQDIIIKELFDISKDVILHGGTSIWRCYKGNRFSEDIDVYMAKDNKLINTILANLEKKDFSIIKKKTTQNSFYSKLEYNRRVVRFEVIFKKPLPKKILKEYHTIDGNYITIFTLDELSLIKEKIHAYRNRRKIRDLYDIFFLMRYIQDKKLIKKEINQLLSKFQKPIDEKDLKILIIEGLVPSVDEIINYLKRL